MEFLSWHYSEGLKYYMRSWMDTVKYIIHYFSPLLLFETLFTPYKRLIVSEHGPGFNIGKKFEAFSFNAVSRLIGAFVRTSLIVAAFTLVLMSFVGGVLGLIFWLVIPFLSYGVYKKHEQSPDHVITHIVSRLQSKTEHPIQSLFDNAAGKFVLSHLSLELSELISAAKETEITIGKEVHNYKELLESAFAEPIWDHNFLYSKNITADDFLQTAFWWDSRMEDATSFKLGIFGRPGMALELTFGYTPTLNNYVTDLSRPQSFSHHLIGREQTVNRIERELTSGQSIFLVGEPGVGKKTVILEFARRAANGLLGEDMSYKRILEFDFNTLLAETRDINQKKAELSQILAEAAYAGNIILVMRDMSRLLNPDLDGYDFTDIFEPLLEKRQLKIIAISTGDEYEQYLAPNARMKKFFNKVEVISPTMTEAMQILMEAASRVEVLSNLLITYQALKQMVQQSDEYITETPFPEKVIEILESCVTFANQNKIKTITVGEVNSVLAEKTGISFERLGETEKGKLGNLEKLIHERLVNQESAVTLIAKTLRSKTVGVVKESRPIGSFLFLGPTGVGKTETAKVLARVYYGSETSIIRFDMAEYSGFEGVERLIGSATRKTPGSLTTAIRNNPAALILFDEIEKASPDIFNLLLTLLDEGYVTDALGKRVSFKNTFVIATSNAGAEYIRQLVSNNIPKTELQKKVVDYVLTERIFSPEFINRFDGVVVYEPLTEDHLKEVASHIVNDLAQNLERKNIHLQSTDEVLLKLAKDGYDPAFGARPMRRLVNLELGDMLGRAILEGQIQAGNTVKLTAYDDFGWEKV